MIIARIYGNKNPQHTKANLHSILEVLVKNAPIELAYYGEFENAKNDIISIDLLVKSLEVDPPAQKRKLFLFSRKNELQCLILNNESGPVEITIYFDDSFFKKDQILNSQSFIESLFSELGGLFCSVASRKEYKLKHEVVENIRPGVRKKVQTGLSIKDSIPGIYWFNIFDKSICEQFGILESIEMIDDKIKKALNNVGYSLQLGPSPFKNNAKISEEIKGEIGHSVFYNKP